METKSHLVAKKSAACLAKNQYFFSKNRLVPIIKQAIYITQNKKSNKCIVLSDIEQRKNIRADLSSRFSSTAIWFLSCTSFSGSAASGSQNRNQM